MSSAAADAESAIALFWDERFILDAYTLSKVTKNGKSVQDKDTFTVTCLATPQHMESYPAGKNIVFDGEVKDTWTKCVLKGDAVLAKPEDYMTLR